MYKGISKVVSFSILCIAVLLSVMVFSDSGFAGVTVDEGPRLEWSVDFHRVIPALEIVKRGGRAEADTLAPLLEKLKAGGVTAELVPLRTEDNSPDFVLQVSSRGSLDDFRRVFYTVLAPEFSLLGGVTEMTIEGDTVQSPDMELVIEANPSTGYGWHVASGSTFTEGPGGGYQMHTRGRGVPERQVLHLSMGRDGGKAITLVYKRPWENESATQHVTLRLSYLPARLDLSDPTTSADPLPPAEDFIDDGAFPPVPETGLPASFDWRSQNILTPVRDQGSCGGGWAFGTVGIMEAAMLKNGFADIDLSEQFLISCNTNGWSCKGGLTAHMYHFDTLAKAQTEVGAVLEADKPFTETDGTCLKSYNHPYKLTDWDFIVPGEFSMPTVDQIKSAIYTYGPVTAGVCAGDAMKSYTTGIFSTDETGTSCYFGGTNHQIDLVGWDDNGGNGYWIMRNSWGPDWGLNGYMYIAYNTSRVGEGASWVTTSSASGKVKVINGSSRLPITELYISHSTDAWGPNYLSKPIPAGGSLNIKDLAAGTYNLKAVFSTGGTFIKESLTVSAGTTTTITATDPPPDLTITKSHTGNFFHGQKAATYTIRVTNSGLGRGTAGTVTVTDILPSGLTATALGGTGWSCVLNTLTCTRSNALQSGDSYPPITLKVNVADNAPSSVTNTAGVSGGGEIDTSNDYADDPTTLVNAPALGALTPSSVTSRPGTPQIFSAVYSDADGYGDLDTVCFEVNSTLSNAHGIYLCYDMSASMIQMYNDDGTDFVGACTPGSPGTLSNSQGALDCGGTSMSASGSNLTINWEITPSVAFASATAKNIYMYAIDNAGLQAAWDKKGTWLIDGSTPTLGLTPSSVVSPPGIGQTFSAVYSDADGYTDLSSVAFLVNSKMTGVSGIYALYVPKDNKLYLYNDDKTDFVGTCTPALPGTLSNSQGTLDCLATSVSGSGNDLTVNWSITPKTAFASSVHKNLYMQARDLAGNATPKWTDKGDWTIASSISGSVKSADGAALYGVTITLSGDKAGSTVTNTAGNYSFSGLGNGSYTVTPGMTGYAFSPENRAVTVSGADVTEQDFTGNQIPTTYSISGTAKNSDGIGMPGITITLMNGNKNITTTTNRRGRYSFSGLGDGSYTVAPGKKGYNFSPESRAVTINGADVTEQDFTGVPMAYSISGKVRDIFSGIGLAGVPVILTGGDKGIFSTSTDSDGNYSFTGLSNGLYLVSPSEAGFMFTPVDRAVKVSDVDVTGQDFTGWGT